jgi:radical SAM superfamily enzyme YgiQ (UPF0313 family)
VNVCSVVRAVNGTGCDAESVARGILSSVADLAHARVDIAIGVYVWAEHIVQRLLPLLRAGGFTGRIILGGPQISYAGPGIDRLYPQADVFVRGYGETALCALARRSGRPVIEGVHYQGQADRCEQARVELHALASPWLTGALPLAGQRFVRWESQRGCPFRCSFCQHREPGARLPRRDLRAERVFREIELFCTSGVDDIAVLDPVFNVGPLAPEILAALAAGGFTGRLSLQCRAESLNDAFLDAADGLDVRMELGLQTIHAAEQAAVNRRNDLRRVDAALAKLRERGMLHEVSLIFGLPEQSLTSFMASVSWCLERRVPVIKAFPLMLLRGTALEQEREQRGLVEDDSTMPQVVQAPTFTREDWRKMAAISDALRRTEGDHPRHLGALLKLADDRHLMEERWRPA